MVCGWAAVAKMELRMPDVNMADQGRMALRASARLPPGLQSRAFNQTYKNLFKVFLELHKCLAGMGC